MSVSAGRLVIFGFQNTAGVYREPRAKPSTRLAAHKLDHSISNLPSSTHTLAQENRTFTREREKKKSIYINI